VCGLRGGVFYSRDCACSLVIVSVRIRACARVYVFFVMNAVDQSAFEETELAIARQSLQADVAYGDESRRLAVMHLEWERIRAVDLFVLFHSFVPSGGAIKSVKVFASDFGLERMAEVR
jgi:hypothetical protein